VTPEPESDAKKAAARDTDGSGDDSDADGSQELARAAREAAALCRSRQQTGALPHGLPPAKLQDAAAYLAESTGMDAAAAEECLLAAAEHWKDFDRWMDEAMMWTASKNETDEEAAKLRQAMEVSLAERERAAAGEKPQPLVNLSEEKLRERFVGSVVLDTVSVRRAWWGAGFACASGELGGGAAGVPLAAEEAAAYTCAPG